MRHLLTWLGLDTPVYDNDAIGKFMAGWSIPAISADYHANTVDQQRRIEGEIRAYIQGLEAEIEALQAQTFV